MLFAYLTSSSSSLFVALRLFAVLSPTFFLFPISCPSPIRRPIPYLLPLPYFLPFSYLAYCLPPSSSSLFLVLRLFGVLSPSFFFYPLSCPSPIWRPVPYFLPLPCFLSFAYLADCPLPSSSSLFLVLRLSGVLSPTFFLYPVSCPSPIWRLVPYLLPLTYFMPFAYLAFCTLPSPSNLFLAFRLFGVLSPTFFPFPIFHVLRLFDVLYPSFFSFSPFHQHCFPFSFSPSAIPLFVF